MGPELAGKEMCAGPQPQLHGVLSHHQCARGGRGSMCVAQPCIGNVFEFAQNYKGLQCASIPPSTSAHLKQHMGPIVSTELAEQRGNCSPCQLVGHLHAWACENKELDNSGAMLGMLAACGVSEVCMASTCQAVGGSMRECGGQQNSQAQICAAESQSSPTEMRKKHTGVRYEALSGPAPILEALADPQSNSNASLHCLCCRMCPTALGTLCQTVHGPCPWEHRSEVTNVSNCQLHVPQIERQASATQQFNQSNGVGCRALPAFTALSTPALHGTTAKEVCAVSNKLVMRLLMCRCNHVQPGAAAVAHQVQLGCCQNRDRDMASRHRNPFPCWTGQPG